MNDLIQTPVNIGPIPVDVVHMPEAGPTWLLFAFAVLVVVGAYRVRHGNSHNGETL